MFFASSTRDFVSSFWRMVNMSFARELGILLLSTPFSRLDVEEEMCKGDKNWHEKNWLYHFRGQKWIEKEVQQHGIEDASWLHAKHCAILGACLCSGKWFRPNHRGVLIYLCLSFWLLMLMVWDILVPIVCAGELCSDAQVHMSDFFTLVRHKPLAAQVYTECVDFCWLD